MKFQRRKERGLETDGIYSFARICSPATGRRLRLCWSCSRARQTAATNERESERIQERERTEKKRTLNLRSPASGRNVSRVDISIPAPTRCFLPREQDSLSPPSSPPVSVSFSLSRRMSHSLPVTHRQPRCSTRARARAHAQSHVLLATERNRENHSPLSLSLSLSCFSSFFIFSFLLYFTPIHFLSPFSLPRSDELFLSR